MNYVNYFLALLLLNRNIFKYLSILEFILLLKLEFTILIYVSNSGIDQLMDYVESICEKELSKIDLKKEFDPVGLSDLLLLIKQRIQSIDCRQFSYLIVPKFADQVLSIF